MKSFTEELIAPCGINCGVCSLYLAYSSGLPEKRGNIRHCVGCKPRNEPLRTYVRSFGEWNSIYYSCRIHPRSYLRGFLRHTRHKKCTRCKTGNINKIRFCYECSNFPCEMLERLEKRYLDGYKRTESPIGNLKKIKKLGMKKFLVLERKNWNCPKCGGVVCVHNGKCYNCEKVTSCRE